MPPFTNISAYLFAPLKELKGLRDTLKADCRRWGLKGTILLSTEGINLFVAGRRENVDALVDQLRILPGLGALNPKYSESGHQPFTRMLVKIKKEIIAFGVQGIDPSQHTSPKLGAKRLKQWLDEGRKITLLDTRNDYEVKLGSFKNAKSVGIRHFREFPNAIQALPESLKNTPIVMFCTGGIRCEKAGPYMESQGFKNIFQLDGGILKYFEETGGEHYEGGCFVFDQRVAVDPALTESEDTQCFHCLEPLSAQDQKDPRYQPATSCPHCFKTPEESMAELIRRRHLRIREITTSLPGALPYVNYRPLKVSAKHDQKTLIEFVAGILPHTDRTHWEDEMSQGGFVDSQYVKVSAGQIVRSGERYYHVIPHTTEPEVNVEIEIIFEDDAIVVVNKPAPLPSHPSGRYHRNTLHWILKQVYHPTILRPAHRLDANTSGVMVFSKSKRFATQLQPQFAKGEVEKIYLATVQGHPDEDEFRCELPISSSPQEVGTRTIDDRGLKSITHFKVIKRNSDGTSELEIRPLTGRTNQIRVHLWKLGFPIVGEWVYLPQEQLGSVQTQPLHSPPLRLHAHKIRFSHPQSQIPVEFQSATKL